MFYYDVVSQKDGKYWYDFNHDLQVENNEMIDASKAASSESETKKIILTAILKSHEKNSKGCNPFSEKNLETLESKVDVRFFSDYQSYMNVGKTSVFMDAIDGLNNLQVQEVRREAISQLDQTIAQLDAHGELPPDHPYTELKKNLKVTRNLLEKIRIEIIDETSWDYQNVDAGTQLIASENVVSAAASYDDDTKTMSLALANHDNPMNINTLVQVILVDIIHELDHASMYGDGGDESLIPPWYEHQYRYIKPDGSECIASYQNIPEIKFRGEPQISTTYSFKLDFSRDENQVFTFDSVVENYTNYPILLGEKEACTPDKFYPSRHALEIHAFQTESRYIAFHDLKITAEEMSLLKNKDAHQDKERQALKNRIKTQLEDILKRSQENGGVSASNPNLMLYYFGMKDDEHEKNQNLADLVVRNYTYLKNENSENCIQPELPD